MILSLSYTATLDYLPIVSRLEEGRRCGLSIVGATEKVVKHVKRILFFFIFYFSRNVIPSRREYRKGRRAITAPVSTQLSCLLPPPLPLSVVAVLPCGVVATPNRAYQQTGQRRMVLVGVLKLGECWTCGTERSEGSVRPGSCPPSHSSSPGVLL